MFIIQVFSKEGRSTYHVQARDIHERLRQIGLEWKTADWAHDQEVIITIMPDALIRMGTVEEKLKAVRAVLDE